MRELLLRLAIGTVALIVYSKWLVVVPVTIGLFVAFMEE